MSVECVCVCVHIMYVHVYKMKAAWTYHIHTHPSHVETSSHFTTADLLIPKRVPNNNKLNAIAPNVFNDAKSNVQEKSENIRMRATDLKRRRKTSKELITNCFLLRMFSLKLFHIKRECELLGYYCNIWCFIFAEGTSHCKHIFTDLVTTKCNVIFEQWN